MNDVPVTYIFVGDDEKSLRTALPEFAANGVKNIVLSDLLISAVMQKHTFAGVIQNTLMRQGPVLSTAMLRSVLKST